MQQNNKAADPHESRHRMTAYAHGAAPSRSYYQDHEGNPTDINESYVGETIEQKVRRALDNNSPITDGAPQIYSERADGVNPAANIRTDRFDEMLDMTNEMHNRKLKERKERQDAKTPKNTDAGDHKSTDVLK